MPEDCSRGDFDIIFFLQGEKAQANNSFVNPSSCNFSRLLDRLILCGSAVLLAHGLHLCITEQKKFLQKIYVPLGGGGNSLSV